MALDFCSALWVSSVINWVLCTVSEKTVPRGRGVATCHHVLRLRKMKSLDFKASALLLQHMLLLLLQLSTRWGWSCLQISIDRGWSTAGPECDRSNNHWQSKPNFIQTSSGSMSVQLFQSWAMITTTIMEITMETTITIVIVNLYSTTLGETLIRVSIVQVLLFSSFSAVGVIISLSLSANSALKWVRWLHAVAVKVRWRGRGLSSPPSFIHAKK